MDEETHQEHPLAAMASPEDSWRLAIWTKKARASAARKRTYQGERSDERKGGKEPHQLYMGQTK